MCTYVNYSSRILAWVASPYCIARHHLISNCHSLLTQTGSERKLKPCSKDQIKEGNFLTKRVFYSVLIFWTAKLFIHCNGGSNKFSPLVLLPLLLFRFSPSLSLPLPNTLYVRSSNSSIVLHLKYAKFSGWSASGRKALSKPRSNSHTNRGERTSRTSSAIQSVSQSSSIQTISKLTRGSISSG